MSAGAGLAFLAVMGSVITLVTGGIAGVALVVGTHSWRLSCEIKI